MGILNTVGKVVSPAYLAGSLFNNNNNKGPGPYSAPTGTIDPWLQQAFDAYMANVGPKRTAKVGAYQGDLQSKLNYGLSMAHDDERTLYNQWLLQHPKPTPVAETPVASTEPEPIDPAKMALAKQAAMQRAELNLRAQGLDPALYMDKISSQYDQMAQTASLNKDPYSVFSDDIATNVVKAENAARQQQFMNEFEGKFGVAADQAALPSTILDDAINTVLGEQKTAAQQQLERGKARGIYNDVGYNAGQAALGTAEQAARSELTGLGSNLVNQYRGGLNEIDDRAFSAYQSFPIGSSTFSLDPYISERNDFLNRTKAGAEGNLRSTLGGRNFFDFGKIGGQAGTAQGALNLRDTDVATAIGERKRQNTMSRGLGSQGAF